MSGGFQKVMRILLSVSSTMCGTGNWLRELSGGWRGAKTEWCGVGVPGE